MGFDTQFSYNRRPFHTALGDYGNTDQSTQS